MKRFLSVVLCFAITFVSCNTKEQQETILEGGFAISIDANEPIEFPPIGGTVCFSLTNSNSIQIKRAADWLDIYVDDVEMSRNTSTIQAGYHQIRLKAPCPEAVQTPRSRENLIQFSLDANNVVSELTIIQAYPYLYFEDAPNTAPTWTWAQRYDNSSQSFSIKSNIKWEVTVSESTLQTNNLVEQSKENQDDVVDLDMVTRTQQLGSYWEANVLKGENDGTLTIGPKAFNYEVAPYENTITISCDAQTSLDSQIEPLKLSCKQTNLKFLVYQKDNNGVYQLVGDSFDVIEPCKPTPIDIKIESEGGLSWEFNCSSWAHLKDETGANIVGEQNVVTADEKVVYIYVDTNDSRSYRSNTATFEIQSGGAKADRKFNIHQSAFIHSIDVEKISVSNVGDDNKQVCLSSSGGWDSSINYTTETNGWLAVNPNESSEGGDKNLVDVKVNSQNPETKKRIATIRFNSKENQLYSDLTIEQAPFIFSLKGAKTVTLEKDDTSTRGDIVLQSSGNWRAESDTNWLTLVDTSGAADEVGVSVNFKSTINTSADERQAKITLTSAYHENNGYANLYTPIEVVVKQHGSFVVDKEGSTLSFGATDNLTNSVNVKCLAVDGWYIKSKPAWITFSPENSKEDDVNVVLTANKNTSYTSREGAVEFAMWDDGEGVVKTRKVNVRQNAYEFTANKNGSFGQDVPAYHTDGYRRYQIDVSCSGEWMASASSGVVLSRSSAYTESLTDNLAMGKGNYLYAFVKNNDRESSRSIWINITCDGDIESGRNPIALQATQEKYDFQVETTPISAVAEVQTGSITKLFTVTCSGKWEIDLGSYSSWLKCTSSSGESVTNMQITVTISPNPQSYARTGVISVKSVDLKKTYRINVSQEYVQFNPITPQTLNFVAVPSASESKTIKIECNGSWVYDETESEIDAYVTPNSGFGDASVKILPEPNYDVNKAIDKKIWFKNPVSGAKQSVSIKMEKYEFTTSVNGGTLTYLKAGGKKEIQVTCSGEWEFSVQPNDWFTCERQDDKLIGTAKSNEGDGERKVEITITSKDNPNLTNNPIRIVVKQSGK